MVVSRRLFAASRRAGRSCSEPERIIRERLLSGSLCPDDALDLFDELLRQAGPASVGDINLLLTAVARAPAASSPVRNPPALAVSLFNRMMTQAAGASGGVAPDIDTYDIVIACCRRMGRLDLGLSAFGMILKTGWRVDAKNFKQILSALCAENKTNEARDIVLRRMPEFGCKPDVFSYSILLKGLCREKRSQEALQLLYTMLDDASTCPPNVVSYNTVIHGFFKEGEVGKASRLFQEMLDRGILKPDVVTYRSMIDGLSKAPEIRRAEEVLRQMLGAGVKPDCSIYTSLIHGYCSVGKLDDAVRMLSKMSRDGHGTDAFICNVVIDNLCKIGRREEAMWIFNSVIWKG